MNFLQPLNMPHARFSVLNFKFLTILLAASILLNSCKSSKMLSAGNTEAALDKILADVPDFSGVLLVADHGKILYHKAKGYKSFETRESLKTTDIFELASLSKQFTAMTIMQMKDAGKLTFDDPIEQYIPGLPYSGITIRHLLTHTSGLPDYQEVMDQHWDKSRIAGNAENIAYLIQYHPPVLFEPGTKYLYSNTGYMLLASITEKVSGQDFIEYCKTRLFLPADMKNTAIRTNAEKKQLINLAP